MKLMSTLAAAALSSSEDNGGSGSGESVLIEVLDCGVEVFASGVEAGWPLVGGSEGLKVAFRESRDGRRDLNDSGASGSRYVIRHFIQSISGLCWRSQVSPRTIFALESSEVTRNLTECRGKLGN